MNNNNCNNFVVIPRENPDMGDTGQHMAMAGSTGDLRKDSSRHGNIRVKMKWRMAIGRVIQENRSKQPNHITRTVKVLLEFLTAAREGDNERVAELLTEYPEVDLNSTNDALGNSPLTLAVKNDNAEMVSTILRRIKMEDYRQSLLIAISMDRDEMTAMMIDSKYDEYSKIKLARGDSTNVTAQFPDDLTPLILASTRNQYEIVKTLLARGETISKPHHAHCTCSSCEELMQQCDELEVAKVRLLTYRGLASDAYITLSCEDPLLTAFQLAQTLRKNGEIEKYYKAEYKKLASQLSEYTVKLLGQVRSGAELDIILRESTHKDDKDRLARLKLAIRCNEKMFVTHPICQKKLQYLWSDGWGPIQRKGLLLQLLWCLAFGVCYPFLAVVYWIYPWGKVGKFLETPIVKFIGEAMYFLVFVTLLVVYSFTEASSSGFRLADDANVGEHFLYYNQTATDRGIEPAIQNVFLRVHAFRPITIVISVHLVGYIWQMLNSMYRDRLFYFTDNGYNLMDLCMYFLNAGSFVCRYYAIIRTIWAVRHFSHQSAWDKLLDLNDTDTTSHAYWIDADRASWDMDDPYYTAEALLSLAILPALTRTTYIMSVSEILGPLLISLKCMFKNFIIFMAIFVVVFVAFIVSFHNLFWYYDEGKRLTAETPLHEPTNAEEAYGTFSRLVRTMLFTLFGMTDASTVEMSGTYKSDVTVATAYVLFGAYNWINVVILLNMLIGMMAKAYDTISSEKDFEWKFDRTKLYLDYMKEGQTLCVPFNMMPTWWSIRNCCKGMSVCCQGKNTEKPGASNPYSNGTYQNEEDLESIDGFINTPSKTGTMEMKVKKARKQSRAKKSEYLRVMELVRERIITAATTPGDEDSGDTDATSELLGQMKGELTQFRHDMAKATSRNDQDKKFVMTRLDELEARLVFAKAQLTDIMIQCSTTHTVIQHDVIPVMVQSREHLVQVDEHVMNLQGDVSRNDGQVKEKLEVMQKSTDQAQFAPIKDTLDTIQDRLKEIRAREQRSRSAASPRTRKPGKSLSKLGLPIPQDIDPPSDEYM